MKCRLKGSDNSPIESAAAGNPGGYPALDPLRDGVFSPSGSSSVPQSGPDIPRVDLLGGLS